MGLDNDDIKQLIAILQRGLSSDEEIEEDNEERVKPLPKSRNKTPKKKVKKKSTNLFDNMTESGMHKDDVEIDKKLAKFPPTQRARNYKPIDAKCRVCGKSEKISPSLVESVERYKCNRCSTSSG